jgi:hypothetical protein
VKPHRSPWKLTATVLAIPAAVVVLAGIVLAIVIVVSMQDKDGDDLAADQVEHVARALVDDLRGARDLTDAETVAAEMFHSRSASVEPLTWSGSLGEGKGITIEARISAVVAESSSGELFAPHTSAGSAERCYRYTVSVSQDAAYEEIPCKGLTESAAPPSSNRPELPADAAERIEALLVATATGVADLVDALRAEFPGSQFTVEAVDTPAGERVVAVGVTPGSDCVLRVRLPDGEIVSPSYDRIWLEPGELGCSAELYTAPPR